MPVPRRLKARPARAGAVALGTLMLCWPAIWNGYPFVFLDTMNYLSTGGPIWQRMLGGHPSAASYDSWRSEIYGAFLRLLHVGPHLFPIVAVQSLITAWVIWLAVRALIAKRPVAVYLVVLGVLCAVTTLAWYTSFIMPDFAVGTFAVGSFVLIACWFSLARWERIVLAAVCVLCAGSHSTVLLLGGTLSVACAIVWAVRLRTVQSAYGIVTVIAVLCTTAALQIVIHRALYFRVSLFGDAPPFLMARMLEDGPARQYLQEHCSEHRWLICARRDTLPQSSDQLLWGPHSLWFTTNWNEHAELQKEQMPLALATLKTYPAAQLRISMHEFLSTLVQVGPYEFVHLPAFSPELFDPVIPHMYDAYSRTRQSRSAMPIELVHTVQRFVIPSSLILLVILVPLFWREGDRHAAALAAYLSLCFLANAFFCGVLSGVYVRYQDRVNWLLPFAACMVVARWLQQRGQSIGTASAQT